MNVSICTQSKTTITRLKLAIEFFALEPKKKNESFKSERRKKRSHSEKSLGKRQCKAFFEKLFSDWKWMKIFDWKGTNENKRTDEEAEKENEREMKLMRKLVQFIYWNEKRAISSWFRCRNICFVWNEQPTKDQRKKQRQWNRKQLIVRSFLFFVQPKITIFRSDIKSVILCLNYKHRRMATACAWGFLFTFSLTQMTTLSSPRPAFCRHNGTVRPSFDTNTA